MIEFSYEKSSKNNHLLLRRHCSVTLPLGWIFTFLWGSFQSYTFDGIDGFISCDIIWSLIFFCCSSDLIIVGMIAGVVQIFPFYGHISIGMYLFCWKIKYYASLYSSCKERIDRGNFQSSKISVRSWTSCFVIPTVWCSMNTIAL